MGGIEYMGMRISFTDKEIRAMKELLWNSRSCCSSTCVYMESKKDSVTCSTCEFTQSVQNIMKKFGMYDSDIGAWDQIQETREMGKNREKDKSVNVYEVLKGGI